jgi:hypothetical protein
MTKYQNDKMTKYQNDKMTKHQNIKMTKNQIFIEAEFFSREYELYFLKMKL